MGGTRPTCERDCSHDHDRGETNGHLENEGLRGYPGEVPTELDGQAAPVVDRVRGHILAMGTDAFVGIDVAVAKAKRLPVCVCVRGNGALEPLALRGSGLPLPPSLPGNVAIV